jgi:hypothetical protein
MIEKDEFDVFLENELKKSTYGYHDDGFKQKVLERLPTNMNRNRSRNLIIYGFGILSCILFILIMDQNIVWNSIIEFSDLINETIPPSLETIIFASMICFILYIIPKVEYSNGVS